MEDKRTIIAMVLVGLIFLLMPAYYQLVGVSEPEPPLESPGDKAEPREDKTRAVPALVPMDPPPDASQEDFPEPLGGLAGEPRDLPPERYVTVETPLQHLTFSTRGGVLASARLKEYKQGGGGPLELVPAGGAGLGVTVQPEAAEDVLVDLASRHFEPDRDRMRVEADGEGRLRLRCELEDGRSIEKVIVVRGDQYGLQAGVALHGFSNDSIVRLTWHGGIALAERDPDLDLQRMKALAYINESLYDVQVDEDEEDSDSERGSVGWVGVRSKYFLCALAPESEARHRVTLYGAPNTQPPYRDYGFTLGTRWGDIEDGVWRHLVYLGPLDLEQVGRYDRDFDRAMDLGFPVVRQIATVLLTLFVAAYAIIPNYGWVIVAFGVVVKILVYPLTHKSYESAARMQELQPKIAALREKYKNNNQKLSQETMKLYREEGVNPLGGCLPLLLQMPIFIALYQVFSSAIQLRQTPWILWVDDLSLPDTITLGGFDLHVLPLLMSAAMFFQSKMTMKDPKQAALVYVMPVVMVFIMWSFSSGLVLYWTVFNVLQIAQQYLTNYLKKQKQGGASTVPARS